MGPTGVGKVTLMGVDLGILKRLSRRPMTPVMVRGAEILGARTPNCGLVKLFPARLMGVVPTLELLTLILKVRVALTTADSFPYMPLLACKAVF